MSAGLPPILVVDDEKNMRISLMAILEDENYAVEVFESAEEGLSRLSTNEFFMLLTDARLGGMSGYEFLKKTKEKWPDMPVLMITAYATPKLAVEALDKTRFSEHSKSRGSRMDRNSNPAMTHMSHLDLFLVNRHTRARMSANQKGP